MASSLPPPPALDHLIFPEQANHNFSRILGDLKRSNLSIANRLRSIRSDAAFVEDVVAAGLSMRLPLVANERCGSWYVRPELKAASAYFKSTDGHQGQWKFSARRLNFHLLELVGRHDGCIIVDSTRRGKLVPDSLSKTIPIWCCVVNHLLFPGDAAAHELHLPANAVSDSERSQVQARIPAFVDSLLALDVDVAALRGYLKKPLRPVWVTQQDGCSDDLEDVSAAFHPVVCCVSSRRVVGAAEMGAGGYVQGAGDDTENWAFGLTAAVWWKHVDRLLAAPEPDLPDLIRSLVEAVSLRAGSDDASSSSAGISDAATQLTQVASGVFVGPLPPPASSSQCLTIELVPRKIESPSWIVSKSRMRVGLGKSKTASRFLRDALPQMCDFASAYLQAQPCPEDKAGGGGGKEIVVLCECGRDLSVGVALALLCWCFEDGGRSVRVARADAARTEAPGPRFTKTAVRQRLNRIMTAMPDAAPSRATLQSVNSFLMDWRTS